MDYIYIYLIYVNAPTLFFFWQIFLGGSFSFENWIIQHMLFERDFSLCLTMYLGLFSALHDISALSFQKQ